MLLEVSRKQLTTLITALINLLENHNNLVKRHIKSRTLANALGDSFEYYIADAFAGTFDLEESEKNIIQSTVFSWKGNQNNPPDLIIRNGDAIEVKKTQGINTLALNSSYPKDYVSNDSFGITKDCRDCEGNGVKWQKDLIYTCGILSKNSEIKSIFFVYGSIFAASKATYTRLHEALKQGIHTINGVEFSESRELGKVKKVDPLGITDLRMRGMWSIMHPLQVFSYLPEITPDKDLPVTIYALIPLSKFANFSGSEITRLSSFSNVQKFGVSVKKPNNPAELIKSILYKIHF